MGAFDTLNQIIGEEVKKGKYRVEIYQNLVKSLGTMLIAYSDQIVHLFRRIPSTDSEPFRPPVPMIIVQSFGVIATLLFYIVRVTPFSQ